jgi:hypothetical protein
MVSITYCKQKASTAFLFYCKCLCHLLCCFTLNSIAGDRGICSKTGKLWRLFVLLAAPNEEEEDYDTPAFLRRRKKNKE